MNTIEYITETKEVLFSRKNLKNEELSARLITDYIVSNGVVYENIGSWVDDVVRIKLKKLEEETTYPTQSKKYKFRCIEYRKYEDAPSQRDVLHVLEKESTSDLLPHLLIFNLSLQARPLKRCASEIDEDREIFVVYYLDDCECEK
ncbi:MULTISPECIES: hypothetical protein [Bacillus cereus group]|uniref:hypothetical protein n=1 Tax=Bacillus cereus group TaxID=86661 RepID=UPI001F241132|nr:hypothetical protein [Bacillus cereus]MDA1518222.1 hypothetical protein [Bacillus cereus]BCC06858.1 hypothetical protein BCM0060_3121 [Bacillus cereus]